MGGHHEEKTPVRCRLDRARLWHCCDNRLPSKVRVDCGISPLKRRFLLFVVAACQPRARVYFRRLALILTFLKFESNAFS
jgi:hypothetical protein